MRVMAAWLKCLCLVAALCCGLVAAARAVDTTPPSEPPPAPDSIRPSDPSPALDHRPTSAPPLPDNPLPGNPLPGTPAPAAAPADASSDVQVCLKETGDYVTHGSAVIYVIGIANSCEKKLRCEVYANISGVKGTSLGHTVMTLGRASDGAAAKKSYEMRVKSAGGIAQISRECKVL